MRPVSTLVLVLAIGVLLCFSLQASATTIFQDDFENQTLHPLSSSVHGSTPPTGGVYSGGYLGYIQNATTAPAPGNGHAGQFAGRNAGNYDWANVTAASTILTVGKVVTFDLDVYVASSSVAGAGLGIWGFADTAWNGQSLDIDLNATGRVDYRGTGSGGRLDVGAFTTNAWVPVHIVADYGVKTFQATVGSLSFSGNFENTSDPLADRFHTLYLGLNVTDQGHAVYYDNLSITTVPEPSMLMLMAAGLLGLLAYAWRKRK